MTPVKQTHIFLNTATHEVAGGQKFGLYIEEGKILISIKSEKYCSECRNKAIKKATNIFSIKNQEEVK